MTTLNLTPDSPAPRPASMGCAGIQKELGRIGGVQVWETTEETDREGGGWCHRFIFDGRRVEVTGDGVVTTELFVRFCIKGQRTPDAEALVACETQVTRELEEAEVVIRTSLTRQGEVCQLTKEYLATLVAERPDLATEAEEVTTRLEVKEPYGDVTASVRKEVFARYGIQYRF